MESQNKRSAEIDKPAFVSLSKSSVDEHQVQLTIKEAIKRSSTFEALPSKNTHVFSKDWHDHDSKNNPNVVSNFIIPSENNCNDSQCLTTYPRSEIVSSFNNTLSDYMESHPIIGSVFTLLFIDDFRVLYQYAMETNNIYPDLIEMEKYKV